jgi:predicted SprT family Zn-dependent metalloprotease
MRRLELVRDSFRELNREFFGGAIPEPELVLSRRLRLSGYVQVRAERWRLVLSIPYHDRYGWDGELEGTLKHEMVHLYLKLRRRPFGHTREFRRLCRQIGGRDYSRPMPRPFRYVYECPQCRRTYRYRVRVRLACAACTRGPRRQPTVLRLKRTLVPKPS